MDYGPDTPIGPQGPPWAIARAPLLSLAAIASLPPDPDLSWEACSDAIRSLAAMGGAEIGRCETL
jgi:hypothetical protein